MPTNTLSTKRMRMSNNSNNKPLAERTQKLSSILRNILGDVSTKECKEELLRIIKKKEREERNQNQLNEIEALEEEEHGEYINKFDSLKEYEKKKPDELIIEEALKNMKTLLAKHGAGYFRRHGLSIFRQTLEPNKTPKKRSPRRNSPHTTSPYVNYNDPDRIERDRLYAEALLKGQPSTLNMSNTLLIGNKENYNPSPGKQSFKKSPNRQTQSRKQPSQQSPSVTSTLSKPLKLVKERRTLLTKRAVPIRGPNLEIENEILEPLIAPVNENENIILEKKKLYAITKSTT